MKILIASAISFLFLFSSAFAQEAQPRAESPEWSAEFVRSESCADCFHEIHILRIDSKADGGMHELKVETRADTVEAIDIYKTLAVVSGPLTSGGTAISIMDLSSDEKITEIYGYGILISPDKRYLLYRKWSPRAVLDASTRIMLYDMEVNSTENRNMFADREPEMVGFQIHPKVPAPSPQGADNTIPYSLDHAVWSLESDRLFTTVLDDTGYQNLLTVKLWGDALTGNNIETCYIPLVTFANASEYASDSPRNIVESIILDEEQIVKVDMYKANGVKATFNVAYLEYCP